MANGDLHLLGTLYTGGTKRLMPTNPINEGNITQFVPGQAIEIRDTDANDAFKLRWREVNAGVKKMLVADRNILNLASWDDLNAQGLVSGKNIKVDGQQYRLRILTGGSERRNASDPHSGGTPAVNEWDQIITCEANYPGLPIPTSFDLRDNASNLNGVHNRFWNWFDIYSWAQDSYALGPANRIIRAYGSVRFLSWSPTSTRNTGFGWRPVLEVLQSTPDIFVNINGTQRKAESIHAKVDGVWRKADSIHTNINGIWRKS